MDRDPSIPLSPEAVRRRIDAVKIWYHVMELAPGVLTPGEYDMRPYLEDYGFPESLDGMHVIDVGASNGFFSFHFEKLKAARVVAADLPSMADHDYPRRYLEEQRKIRPPDEIERIDREELHAAFEAARDILGSKVERHASRIYDLPAAFAGCFDLCFCSNVLGHLRDPVAGLEALFEITKPGGRAIVASPVDLTEPTSYALFLGMEEVSFWWVPSPEALKRMCALAGFSQVEWKGAFTIAPRSDPARKGSMGIVHCRR